MTSCEELSEWLNIIACAIKKFQISHQLANIQYFIEVCLVYCQLPNSYNACSPNRNRFKFTDMRKMIKMGFASMMFGFLLFAYNSVAQEKSSKYYGDPFPKEKLSK